jgi:hypothetical protein
MMIGTFKSVRTQRKNRSSAKIANSNFYARPFWPQSGVCPGLLQIYNSR